MSATRKKIKTRYPGVRYREHKTRKHGIQKDRYFFIRYRLDGKLKEEGVGWATKGMTPKKAAGILGELQQAHRIGKGPQTLDERRRIAQEEREAEKRRRAANLTFAEFFTDTYLPYAKANKSERSWRREQSLYELWIKPVVENVPLSNVAFLHLERIKRTMTGRDKSPRTVSYALATIRQVFNMAHVSGKFRGENPTKGVKKPTSDNRRRRFLSREEAEILLAELEKRSKKLHDMALLSLHSGLRAGEIFSLTWDCVDLEKGTLFIKDPKNKRNRYAHMSERAKAMLAERKAKTKANRSDLVFADRKGNKIVQASNAFGRAVDDLGLNDGVTDRRDKLVFHTLRHTFASWLVEDRQDPFTVKKLMGHSTLAMTERYSHVREDALSNAVKNL